MNHIKTSLLLLILFLSLTCFSNDTLTIVIRPSFRGIPVQLNSTDYINNNGDTLRISRVRIYISNIELKSKTGETHTAANSYHLIDLEKPASLNIKLKSGIKDLSKIRFSVGVDSASCVSGAMSGDLDPIYGMYWAWNSGYINAKIEGTSNQCKTHNNRFEFHIGGYLSPYQTIQNVQLETKAKNGRITIDMDLNEWFEDIDLGEENSILIPGGKAVEMSKRYKKMFSISAQ